jgi:hypothetical protein
VIFFLLACLHQNPVEYRVVEKVRVVVTPATCEQYLEGLQLVFLTKGETMTVVLDSSVCGHSAVYLVRDDQGTYHPNDLHPGP